VHPTLRDHVRHTFGRLGGHGLDLPEDDADLRALLAYVVALRPPPPAEEPNDPALVARGKEFLLDDERGCVSCHMDGGTDRTRHDVGSGRFIEKKLTFDTPSLRSVGMTAPYFHMTRYCGVFASHHRLREHVIPRPATPLSRHSSRWTSPSPATRPNPRWPPHHRRRSA
jgi:hypothetical protein